MVSRLQDLISTADKQLASRSYDAAIDNYRTALGEPGAAEARVDQLLETACRARDAALGVARPAESPAQPGPLNVEVVAPRSAGPPIEPDPARPIDGSPIEPPCFHLIEDDPSMLERSGRHEYAEVVARQPMEPPIEPDPAPPVGDSPIEPPGFHPIEDDPSMLERSHRHGYAEVAASQPVEPPAGPRIEPHPAPPVDNGPIEPPGFHLIEDDPSMLERSHRHGNVEMVALRPAEPPAGPRIESDPAPPVDGSPIEPPGFHLIEDDPSMLERSDRHEFAEPKPLSILDPTPLPQEPDNMGLARIAVAALIVFIVCGALFYASFGRSITPRSSLTSGVTTPVLEFKTEPEYTPEARQARIQGTVMLDVEIQPDGSATVQRVTQGLDPGLDRRAVEAVSKWRFRPAMKNGRPVKTVAHVAVNFRLL